MRKSLVFLLTLIFVFSIFAGPAASRADAVVVSSIVVGTVIAAMAAAGIGLTVSGMTSSQLSDWVSGKLNSWATSIGGSVQDHIDNNLITVTANGIISVGNAAANGIKDFIQWLVGEDNITDNSTGAIINSDTVLVMSPNQMYYPCIVQNAYYALKIDSGTAYVVTALEGIYGGPLIAMDQVGTYKLWRRTGTPPVENTDVVHAFDVNTLDNTTGLYYSTQYWMGYVQASDVESNTGFYPSIREALDAIKAAIDNNTFGQSLEYDTGVITIPTIQTDDKWFLDVGAEPGATIETVTDGVIADTIEGDLTVSGEVAEEEPEFVVDEPIAVSGLTEVFPFCIPFDIYALLSCLSAEPQTPVFTARFVVPGIIDQEFTIDLTPFNTVAQIVRTLELLAFIIGLALVTRERFLRS